MVVEVGVVVEVEMGGEGRSETSIEPAGMAET